MEREGFEIKDLESLDSFLSNRDNSVNTSYISQVPDKCKEYPCVLGIDEAGRGPVLGPMVYGIAFCPINEATTLDSLGCADSKTLNEEKRETLFCSILENKKIMGWAVEVISPNVICNSMYSRFKCSLNQVSMNSAIGLIRTAETRGVKISKIFVDTVGPPEKYQAYLKSLFPKYDITVAKKADSTYPIVSAASICAKVSRDHALKVWDFQEGLQQHDSPDIDFGSGYPGDGVTKKFLLDNCDPVFGFPQLVRFSWSTAENLLDSHAYYVEWEDDEEENNPESGNQTITSFFKFSNKPKINKKSHVFFKERCLSRNVEL